jgi:hypothetical protein
MPSPNNPAKGSINISSLLTPDLLSWLLEPDNPSVRYFALTDLLDRKESDPEVKKVKAGIMEYGIVPKILEKQHAEGFWGTGRDFYTAKYKGTVWQLLILAELGADGQNANIKKGCEYLLAHSQDSERGGFAIHESAKNGGGRQSEVIPCLTGNMVWTLIALGYLTDARVQRGIDWINEFQRFDDGDGAAPAGGPYDRYEMCWGGHTCHMGVVKTLKALSQIPSAMRSKATVRTIDRAVEYLLLHHVYKKSHNYKAVSKPGWLKFAYPLMYQTDVLEILRILTSLGCRDTRMQEAIDLVISKRDKSGRWKMENTFNGKIIVDIEQKGEASKWITLNALRAIKRYYGKEKMRNRD